MVRRAMNTSEKENVEFTTVLNKYPSFRDDKINGCWKWLAGRRADDNAEGLWRVHDKLYDLKGFVNKHPGGKEWLTLTEGTDVTEAFESYHIFKKASEVLLKYYVRDAEKPRNYKFTFKENGFYQTLKRRVAKRLESVDKDESWRSKWYLDLVVVSLFLTAITAVRVESLFAKIIAIIVAGQLMGWLNSLSHNFIHQRNNFRMYAANLVLVGWRDWRVFHGLSHHLYPNTAADFEMSGYEPFLLWIPKDKSLFQILFSYVASPFTYAFLFHATFLIRFSGLFFSRKQFFYWDELIALTVPMAMFFLGSLSFSWKSIAIVFVMWNAMILIGAFLYSVIAVNAGHHIPTNVHEGDEFKSFDYGVYQLSATIDRIEAGANLFITLTHFGEHMLHHMFPSLDHSLLPKLREVLIETCSDFEEDFRECSMWEALVGQFQQLGRTDTIKFI